LSLLFRFIALGLASVHLSNNIGHLASIMAPTAKRALSALQPKKVVKSNTAIAPPAKLPVIKINHGFESLGTHCLRYISPELKSLIDSDAKLIVGAFDLDDTLVKTKSGGKFPRTAEDWQWWHNKVPESLNTWIRNKDAEDQDDSFSKVLVLFTNQGGVTNTIPTSGPNKPSLSFAKLHSRLHQVVSSPQLAGLPLAVYAATKKSKAKMGASTMGNDNESPDAVHSEFRKPGPGMWNQLKRDVHPCLVLKDRSVYVGDAAGRKGDFSDSDKNFAQGLGLKFQTPEEFFSL
jgi:polynucleotide 3'-phosphatase